MPRRDRRGDPQLRSREQRISSEEREGWQHGANRFRQFWRDIPEVARLALIRSGEHDRACLQAMFLGEKPASFGLDYIAEIPDPLFESYGLRRKARFIYRPDLAAHTMDNNPDLFPLVHTSGVDQTIKELSAAPVNEHHVARGVLAGYPRKSAEAYDRAYQLQIHGVLLSLCDSVLEPSSPDRQLIVQHFYMRWQPDHPELYSVVERLLQHFQDRLGISARDVPRLVDELRYISKSKLVGAYGIRWRDYENSEESQRLQWRLRQAFEQSGILENT